jgi:hypothetical protein
MGTGEEIIKDLRLGNKSNERQKSVIVIVKHLICELIIGKVVCQTEKLFKNRRYCNTITLNR